MSCRHFKSTLVGRLEISFNNRNFIPTWTVFTNNNDPQIIYNKNYRIQNQRHQQQQRCYSNELHSKSDIRSGKNKKNSTGGKKQLSQIHDFQAEGVDVDEFNSNNVNDILKAQTEYENSLKYTSRSDKNQIRRDKREKNQSNNEDGGNKKVSFQHNFVDNWRIRSGNNGNLHDNSNKTLSDRIKYNDYIENMKKSKEILDKDNNNFKKIYTKPKRNQPVNNRYEYFSEINKVKDNFSNSPIPWSTESSQSISKPISSPSSLIPTPKKLIDTHRYKLTDLNFKLWKLIKEFPIVLLFKPNETYNNHYSWEKLTNLLETENKIYNEKQSDVNNNNNNNNNDIEKIDLNFIDPNNLKLLVDYFIINDLKIVENTFTNFTNKKTQINSSSDHNDIDLSFVFNSIRELNNSGHIVCISELGFKSTNNILEIIKENTKMYKPVCCMLNTIDHPFLTKIRKSIHHASNEELLNEKFKQELKRGDELSGDDDTNKILESNMYSIASLGLIKVQKKLDGTIFLTEK
ncbi:hypothetical protein B5S28_g1642 [[Candida] boidinii]|nr:hypothetical protein B5S28_g1642 [[Candida] boidinii]